jgi:hypothetical protein
MFVAPPRAAVTKNIRIVFMVSSRFDRKTQLSDYFLANFR